MVQIKTKAKALVVSLSNIAQANHFSENLANIVDEQNINQLKNLGLRDQFRAKTAFDDLDLTITGLFSLTHIPQTTYLKPMILRMSCFAY